jgi:hypothetical protein
MLALMLSANSLMILNNHTTTTMVADTVTGNNSAKLTNIVNHAALPMVKLKETIIRTVELESKTRMQDHMLPPT